jgi:hypothetical protein
MPREGYGFFSKSGAAWPAGVETQTSAARVSVVRKPPRSLAGAVARMAHVLFGLWPGGAVLSRAARPKSAAPVSLAGFYPPAAAAVPWRGCRKPNQ